MVKNKEKQFDCIKMKSRIQAQIYAETQNMSKEELLRYFNGGAKAADTAAPRLVLSNGQCKRREGAKIRN